MSQLPSPVCVTLPMRPWREFEIVKVSGLRNMTTNWNLFLFISLKYCSEKLLEFSPDKNRVGCQTQHPSQEVP